MAAVKSIGLRLKSMKKIHKIVKTMKVVSVAKYATAKKELKVARPFGAGAKVFFDKLNVPDPEERPEKLLIALSSDRGLCGALHKNVSLKTKEEFTKLPNNSKIICMGEKSRIMLQQKFGAYILGAAKEIGRKPPTFIDASKVAIAILTIGYKFTSGKIIYNVSQSAVSYVTTIVPIYSLPTVKLAPTIQDYDSLDDEIIQNYLEFSVASILFYAMKEAATSEQASRVKAMDQATRAAEDMIVELSSVLNRSRQAAITTELIEVTSGAMAVTQAHK